MNLKVETAEREKLKIPVLLSGVSGSGKTLSALFLAFGIVSEMFPDMDAVDLWLKIGVIDTEHRRSLLNANVEKAGVQVDKFLFVDLEEPFSIDRYEAAFNMLLNSGCEVIIIDSTSHQWEGKGGMIDEVDKLGGRFSDWKKVKPIEDRFRALAINDKVHVISTSRVKQDYVVEANENGKMAPTKVGLKMTQKDNLEYEFAVSLRIEQGAIAYPMKDNSDIFDAPRQLTVDDGRKLYQWSEKGIDVAKLKREQAKQNEVDRQRMVLEIEQMESNSELSAVINRAKIKVGVPIDQFDYKITKKLYDQLISMVGDAQ